MHEITELERKEEAVPEFYRLYEAPTVTAQGRPIRSLRDLRTQDASAMARHTLKFAGALAMCQGGDECPNTLVSHREQRLILRNFLGVDHGHRTVVQ
jgi:hypothetical protein